MRLRKRARISAALAQGALTRTRRKLGLDLLNLLPDKVHHKTRAWREMPSRWKTRLKGTQGAGNPLNTRTSMPLRKSSNTSTKPR